MSPWRDNPFDPLETTQFALTLIDDPSSVIFVHEKGLIGGTLTPIFFNTQLALQELFWYADESGKTLLDALENWGLQNGATCSMLSALSYEDEYVNKKYQKMYKKMNYLPQEIHYKKDLK